jgi:hypothetical protein
MRSRRAMLGRSGCPPAAPGWRGSGRTVRGISVEPIPYRAEAGEPGPHLPEVAKLLVGSCAGHRPVDVVVGVVAVGAEHTGIALDHIRIARPWRAAVTSSGIDPPPSAVNTLQSFLSVLRSGFGGPTGWFRGWLVQPDG